VKAARARSCFEDDWSAGAGKKRLPVSRLADNIFSAGLKERVLLEILFLVGHFRSSIIWRGKRTVHQMSKKARLSTEIRDSLSACTRQTGGYILFMSRA
jgi:hypothetical protein